MTKLEDQPSLADVDLDGVAVAGRDGTLTIAHQHREAVESHLRAVKARIDADAARFKPKQPPGRDGERVELVEHQAADANALTRTVKNIANDPVEWLFNRGSLTQRQYEAAQRIRADFEAGEIGSNRAKPFSGDRIMGGALPGDLTLRQAEAIRRYTLCLKPLGIVGERLVRLVVIDCKPLKDIGERMGMDKNYRVPRLAEALDVVADFYRL
jgi:hypothetical protein